VAGRATEGTSGGAVGFALLAFVEAGARYGYELKQRWDAVLGTSRPLQFGQIYATLGRLLRDGLVELDAMESGQGPARKCYVITDAGRDALEAWLHTPVPPESHLDAPLFTKFVLALQSGRDVQALVDAQRAAHLAQMRELTQRKLVADRAQALHAELALFHLEADLRFLDHAVEGLAALAQEVRS
jgi:DNA-binding PadR family transcriptional regulator